MPNGAWANPTGDPIGGGPGYRDIFVPESGTLVRNLTELLNALNEPGPRLIYIADDAEIDLTNLPAVHWPDRPSWHQVLLELPDQTTLVSGRGRGRSPGGLLRARRKDFFYAAIGVRGNA